MPMSSSELLGVRRSGSFRNGGMCHSTFSKRRPLPTLLFSVRNQRQIDFIVKRFPEYEGKVTGIVVPVIEAPGAYDEAVKDVDAIIHAASPVQFSWDDPSEVIDPAVKGATGILASAAKYGKNVKRVVLTSSALALFGEGKPAEYDEVSRSGVYASIQKKYQILIDVPLIDILEHSFAKDR